MELFSELFGLGVGSPRPWFEEDDVNLLGGILTAGITTGISGMVLR